MVVSNNHADVPQHAPGGECVSASGKIIAAWRALETREPRPLFVDPLAEALAGAAALAEAERLAVPFKGGATAGAATEDSNGGTDKQRRRYCVSNVGARVSWFDAQLDAALAGKFSDNGNSAAPPRQVVILGAGFDTRPWRLDSLPAGIKWWEVDVPAVAAAKRAELERLGAGFEPADGGANGGARHPLRAASWAAVAADLSRPGFCATLAAAGLDLAAPIVWVAEGLLMYFTRAQSDALVSELAASSPPGSVLIAHNSTQELLDKPPPGGYSPFPSDLIKTWLSGWPTADAPGEVAARLNGAGWPDVRAVTSRARVAAALVADGRGGLPAGGEVGACVDFGAEPDAGNDRWAVFVAASK